MTKLSIPLLESDHYILQHLHILTKLAIGYFEPIFNPDPSMIEASLILLIESTFARSVKYERTNRTETDFCKLDATRFTDR